MSIYSMGELYYPNSPDKPKYFDISDEVMDALDALRVEMANINAHFDVAVIDEIQVRKIY